MKTLLPLIVVLIASASAQERVIDTNREIVFNGVNVIPMDKERVVPNQVVVVRNGKITSIGNQGSVKYSRDALVLESKGKYLMPGLAEMHAHVPPIDDIEPMKEILVLFAANGITTIRGMLGHPKHLELRDKIKKGEILGPRFYTSGPSINGQSARSAATGADMVREQKKAGYDFLKLHPGLTNESFTAIASTAREVDIPFAGHVSFDVGIWRAIDAGYATIDHLDGFIEGLIPRMDTIKENQTGLFGMFVADKADTSLVPKLMTSLKQHNVWVVPTQALAERWFASDKTPEMLRTEPEMVYMKPDILDNWVTSKTNLQNNPKYDSTLIQNFIRLRRTLIYQCNKYGVGLLLGSDAPQVFDVPGFSLHHELEYLVNSGLSPYEALRTGTVNVAMFYNRAGESGTIKAGAVSDMVLLNGNPLADIRQTRNIEGVMLGTRWLSKKFIDQELKKLEKR